MMKRRKVKKERTKDEGRGTKEEVSIKNNNIFKKKVKKIRQRVSVFVCVWFLK